MTTCKRLHNAVPAYSRDRPFLKRPFFLSFTLQEFGTMNSVYGEHNVHTMFLEEGAEVGAVLEVLRAFQQALVVG